MIKKTKTCLLTFDIEEWFQVENLRNAIPKSDWDFQHSSVVNNTIKILNILKINDIKATFFVLGLVVEKNPEIVKMISQDGHEVASHGYGHDLTYNLDETQLFDDIKKSKEILEQLIGNKVVTYRAPNFSVNERLVKVLYNLGFKYDSSYNPFQLNSRYGKLENPEKTHNSIFKLKDDFFEIPLSTLKIHNQNIPMAGGAYFRIIPFFIFKQLAKMKLEKDGVYNFYLHPWEFEPEQPRIKKIKLNYRLRHYTGLKRTEIKFEKLIKYLRKQNCQFYTISEFINHNKFNDIKN